MGVEIRTVILTNPIWGVKSFAHRISYAEAATMKTLAQEQAVEFSGANGSDLYHESFSTD